jgi:hypothetical protein
MEPCALGVPDLSALRSNFRHRNVNRMRETSFWDPSDVGLYVTRLGRMFLGPATITLLGHPVPRPGLRQIARSGRAERCESGVVLCATMPVG